MMQPEWFAWLYSGVATLISLFVSRLAWNDIQQMRNSWNDDLNNKYQTRLNIFAVTTLITCAIWQILQSTIGLFCNSYIVQLMFPCFAFIRLSTGLYNWLDCNIHSLQIRFILKNMDIQNGYFDVYI